jgi:putative ABC transport system ATP-binding protein
MITLDRVSKIHRRGTREVRALDGVSLGVERGEFVSVVGPSGSGKSTLLHLIGGLDVATGGEITIAGRALSGMSDDEITLFRRRHVGFVFQSFNLLPTLSTEENVGLPLLLDGVPRRDVRRRVARMLELAGLVHRHAHRPEELSGGEMQRVALARALVIEPLVLLADEPTGNLDSQTSARMLDWMRETADALEQTVVMVTHDLRAAARADRIVTLEDGKIVGEATSSEPRGARADRSAGGAPA